MSVVVAICDGETVYMGCDTQTTTGEYKRNNLTEANCKISKLDNGILLGICGSVKAHQVLISNPEIFNLPEDGILTRKHIVVNIIPKINEVLKDSLGDEKEEGQGLPVSIIIAYKDKCYCVRSSLKVIRITKFIADGAGGDYAFYNLSCEHELVRARLLKALRTSAVLCESVSKPFVLIDTKKLEYEIVEK
ncbi:MAG: hypothetical protein KBS91_00920 [Firmicutes bacterium]|nr:hypothetical protein [Candidatus Caballimonas caccae]